MPSSKCVECLHGKRKLEREQRNAVGSQVKRRRGGSPVAPFVLLPFVCEDCIQRYSSGCSYCAEEKGESDEFAKRTTHEEGEARGTTTELQVKAGQGVKGQPEDVKGVKGQAEDVKGVKGQAEDVKGVKGQAEDVKGVKGQADDVKGVKGQVEDVKGVKGQAGDVKGVKGQAEDVKGVKGQPEDVKGVKGQAEDVKGVKGQAGDVKGVKGQAGDVKGVKGQAEEIKRVKGQAGDVKGVKGQAGDVMGVKSQVKVRVLFADQEPATPRGKGDKRHKDVEDYSQEPLIDAKESATVMQVISDFLWGKSKEEAPELRGKESVELPKHQGELAATSSGVFGANPELPKLNVLSLACGTKLTFIRDTICPEYSEKTLPSSLYLSSSMEGTQVMTKIDLDPDVAFGPLVGLLAFDKGKPGVGRDVDGDGSSKNWMHFVRMTSNKSLANLRLCLIKGRVYFRVTRPIERDSELLL
ncbi:involucrin [Penaeus vannamei]|uniref:involucrin n=1 Tax=Penaeus vannamei TaxID=6689 RepID=UPI00387F54B7